MTREGLQGTHLGFGHGTHYCLGAPLARLELEIALSCLLREFPEMEIAPDEEPAGAWLKGPMAAFRGLERLRLVLEPSRPVEALAPTHRSPATSVSAHR